MSVVYRLIDPRNQSTRYVGLTENLLTRFIQHLRCVDKNARKNDWVHELDSLGLVPIAEQLELITDRSIAAKRERYWMQHYRYLGHDLFNAALPATEIKPAMEIEEEVPAQPTRHYAVKIDEGPVDVGELVKRRKSLTIAQVAGILNRTERRVRGLIHEGKLEKDDQGMIKVASVRSYLAGKQLA